MKIRSHSLDIHLHQDRTSVNIIVPYLEQLVKRVHHCIRHTCVKDLQKYFHQLPSRWKYQTDLMLCALKMSARNRLSLRAVLDKLTKRLNKFSSMALRSDRNDGTKLSYLFRVIIGIHWRLTVLQRVSSKPWCQRLVRALWTFIREIDTCKSEIEQNKSKVEGSRESLREQWIRSKFKNRPDSGTCMAELLETYF